MTRCWPLVLVLFVGGCKGAPAADRATGSGGPAVTAVFAEEDLPAKWKDFVELNADHFRR